ncbi:MAG: hypothetical protein OEU90_06875 [Gammaproteobacteria bacterium]|nr:hypothetical protein [Gammaproteobacteria bacterium]MDH3751625.1 hypothetical protein [Gammaproteobacteria bacterium]MDH3805179.1 hypothetical protein [Gammaproteobacteria bacterium]
MNNHSNVVASSLAVIGLFVFANPASATDLADIGLENEVNACVAEVREHADFADAVRVRHDIVAIERRTVGYTLNISTSVYGKADREAIRAYATTCVVNGDNKPLRFTINAKS